MMIVSNINTLPLELLVFILSFIPPFSLDWARNQRVCQRWHLATHSPAIFHTPIKLKQLLKCDDLTRLRQLLGKIRHLLIDEVQ